MRIDAFNKINQMYGSSKTKRTLKTKAESFSDKLEISRTGKDYHVAKQIVLRTPDVREDKVADIKQRMEKGNYNINMQEVADKLTDRYFSETV